MLLLPACKNIGEFVKDGTCTCPPGHIAIEGECMGMCFVFNCGHCEGGPTDFPKKLKMHFSRGIEKFFQEVTAICPEH